MIILTLLVLTMTLINQSIGLYCPTGCTCVQKTVRCIRLHLKAIPTAPQDTAILDLRYNQIHGIPSMAFEGLSELHTIFLSENQITLIHDDAFKRLKSLKYLYLNNNRISKISSNAFEGLNELTSLYLENNDIWEFDSKTFSNLPQLGTLFLFKNKIIGIPENSFSNVPQLKRIRLDSNPIECDCGLYAFIQYYKQKKIQTNIALSCSSPENLYGKTFTDLKDEDFHCIKPKILNESTSNDSLEIKTGDSFELPCKAIGDPEPEIVWMQNSNEIISSTMASTTSSSSSSIQSDSNNNNSHMQILENGSLKITKANIDDIGIYECMAKNSLGEIKSRPVRMVINNNDRFGRVPSSSVTNVRQTYNNNRQGQSGQIALPPLERPRFIVPPNDQTVTNNQKIILHCYAFGRPLPLVHWYFNGRQLSQSTDLNRIHENGTLVILYPTPRDGGTYKCEASNHLGMIYASAKVHVNDLPEIILAPQNQTVKTGTKLILECDADGEPQPKLWWKYNGNILEEKTTEQNSELATNQITFQNENTELLIENIKESDSGIYSCIAENINGITEATAQIIVEKAIGPPRIIFGPYNMEVLPGTTIELPCKSDEVSAPQVKWRKDGRILTELGYIKKYQISSTGSLYLKNLTETDTGRYECTITNEYGRDTASGLVQVRSNEILAPGDRFVRIAFAEASREIDLAINNTIETIFSPRQTNSNPNYGDLFRVFRFPDAPTRQLARAAEIYERTLVNIRKHIENGANLTVPSHEYEFQDLISREHLHLIAELSGCLTHRRLPNCTDMCFHSRYRNIDGTCNNLNNPNWGASLTGFRRIAKPIYENGLSMPIGWMKNKLYNGYSKPSARLLSTTLITTNEITPDDHITHMVMQWGQFLDHDLDHAIPSVSQESWDGVDCKKTCEFAPPCYPIDVPPNDPRIKNRRCIDLVRSSAICGSGMTSVFFDSIQPREQINQLTSYLDASQVYGYTIEFANELRNLTSDEGLLRTGVHFPNQKNMLPFAAPQDGIDCRRNLEESNINCFVAGDIRANEQVGLLAMHTIWMREHNRIALKLKELNPHWDGDTLYEESRKIVGAQMQHITYKEWLPIIIGRKGMEMLGEYRGYDATINPSISNEFATAALRFGHTLINPILHRLNETFQPIAQGHLQLHKAFFAPWRLVYEGGVDPLMRGMFSVPAKLKTSSQNLNSELTEKLFHTSHAVALDLAAINIQRGRDHGIPGYNEYRKFCNLTVAQKFDDLKKDISDNEIRKKLKQLYGHPSNIDVWIGGVLEDQIDGGKVGPLFRCLLVEQFKKLRDGDRFYYENPTVFMPEQLREIKQSTLGRVLCDNGDNITQATDNVFLLPDRQGGYKQCTEINGINLYFWQDCGTCNSLPPILNSYVPHTYQHQNQQNTRQKRFARTSTEAETNLLYNHQNETNLNEYNNDLFEMNEERVSGLEEVISSFQKEIKKLRKKIKKIEQTCQNLNNQMNNNSNNNNKHQHRHCQDSLGNRRLNNEIWNQDDCTKCQCKHPDVTCTKEKCNELNCPNNQQPIKIPGECCPQCTTDNINISIGA